MIRWKLVKMQNLYSKITFTSSVRKMLSKQFILRVVGRSQVWNESLIKVWPCQTMCHWNI
jgi:hypothetical protein